MDDLVNDCEEDRYFRASLPVLSSIGVTDLSSIPCLSALLRNLHLSMKAQYAYEEVCTYFNLLLFVIRFGLTLTSNFVTLKRHKFVCD